MASSLLDLAKAVKRGAKLLDRKIPTWRHTLRSHADEFDIAAPECCILGTLEHFSGRMRQLSKKHKQDDSTPWRRFSRGRVALNLSSHAASEHGFEHLSTGDSTDYDSLNALWRAEFER